MNNDFALITLAAEAPVACGYFSLYQPPSTGSGTFSITTAGASWLIVVHLRLAC